MEGRVLSQSPPLGQRGKGDHYQALVVFVPSMACKSQTEAGPVILVRAPVRASNCNVAGMGADKRYELEREWAGQKEG